MTLKLEFGNSDTVNLRSHYEQIAKDTVKLLWGRKWLIAAFLVTPAVLAFLVLVLIGPRYTAEATIELGFSRKGGAFNTKTQESIANLDASVLLDSAARVLRSRPIAGVVVTRLGLDKDPQYTHNPLFVQALTFVQAVLGLPQPESTPHDRAVNGLLRRVGVTAQPRTYVISITATADRPERARMLVNAVGSAYLQSRMMQEVSTAENELKEASAIYGVRHPQYQLAEMKLRHLEAELNALGEESKDGAKIVAGDSFMAGDVVVGPSSAVIGVILGVALAIGLACGIWTALHEATVKSHVEAILRKIRVYERAQAAGWAMNRIRPFVTIRAPRREPPRP
ncbi:Wzz/FepE/Etk N-terminal domain-containing protein [Bradyrhizobium sp. NP1]|uniref:Wzz/FepE/Etk N-terminal domain-containing protein n=1 Tax=Bradyrhizobium sp. NP1 TaxID=3049772 RepID=UPI0025A6468A|nr:Wzz/FepE/Etk N-terminal domain-containing protein [Bradyrhizobium sp. NP1]WJR77319.1 Wzz/FepE/Etk N-terminal domain-containing protein [Bradyrhizobium sp. NP1]